MERRFGTSTGSMSLILRNASGETLATLDDDNKQLGFYNVEDNFEIHVIDEDPNSIVRQLESYDDVQKYVMSNEDYDKLPDNAKKFKQNLMKTNPELFNVKKTGHGIILDPDHQKELSEAIKVGDRCRLPDFIDDVEVRGEIMYVGKVPDMGEGYFVGVKLDEPYGKNNGTFNTVKYFECLNKYGVFCRPSDVEVGDYPELEIDEI